MNTTYPEINIIMSSVVFVILVGLVYLGYRSTKKAFEKRVPIDQEKLELFTEVERLKYDVEKLTTERDEYKQEIYYLQKELNLYKTVDPDEEIFDEEEFLEETEINEASVDCTDSDTDHENTSV